MARTIPLKENHFNTWHTFDRIDQRNALFSRQFPVKNHPTLPPSFNGRFYYSLSTFHRSSCIVHDKGDRT